MRTTISLEKEIFDLLVLQAKKAGLNRSAYITTLITKERRD